MLSCSLYREVVEEMYCALQAELDTLKTEHTTHMDNLIIDTATSRKHFSDMCYEVNLLLTYFVDQ